MVCNGSSRAESGARRLEPGRGPLRLRYREETSGRRAATGGGDGTGKAAPSHGALRALMSNPSNPRPCHHLTNWGDVDAEDPQPDGAHKPKSMAHPGPSRVLFVFAWYRRELSKTFFTFFTLLFENRGPEEFTLRTASGGENNPKVKVKSTSVTQGG